jgi:hypothetical protein
MMNLFQPTVDAMNTSWWYLCGNVRPPKNQPYSTNVGFFCFMWVTMIADVTLGDGKQLMQELFNGHPKKNGDMAQWPLQRNPAAGAWMLWKIHLMGLVMQKMQELPSRAKDTTAWHAGQTYHKTGWRHTYIPRLVVSRSTFQACLKTKMEYKWLFKHTSRDVYFMELVTAIQYDTAIAISDGSHNHDWGAASWRIFSSAVEMCQ